MVDFQDHCILIHFSKRYLWNYKHFDNGLRQVAGTINSSLANLFGQYQDLRVIAEPGRYFACSTHTLAVNIISKKSKNTGSEKVTNFS